MVTMVAHAMISADGNLDEWTCDLQAHGVTASGRFVVALRPQSAQALCQIPAGLSTDVRLEISKDSPEPGIRLLAATLHILGTVTWLSVNQIDHLLATDVLPSEVSMIAEFDDGLIVAAVRRGETGKTAGLQLLVARHPPRMSPHRGTGVLRGH